MLSLTTAFWGLVILFAIAGMMRGWTREIVVTASVILALFTINQLMSPIFGILGWDNNVDQPENVRRYQFFMMSAFLLLLTFIGYQGPTLARSRVGDRLNREGHTELLTTHYLEEAEALCGRIAMLKQGRGLSLIHI